VVFVFAASAAKFENEMLVARRREYFCVLGAFCLVTDLPPKQVLTRFKTQELTRFNITTQSIFGCDQQNLENFLSYFKWSGNRLAHVFADGYSTAGHYFFITKTLSKRLCTRHSWINILCRRSGRSEWKEDRTQMRLRLKVEKLDFRLRSVIVPEVYTEARRNGVETEINRDKPSNCNS